MSRRLYEYWENDRMVDFGTREELAKRHGKRPETIAWLSTPSARLTRGLRTFTVKMPPEDAETAIGADLTKRDRRVWNRHMDGRPMSDIARETGRSVSDIRAIITGVWYSQNEGRRCRTWAK